MDGIFCKQRFLVLNNIAGLISGVFLIFLFGIFLYLGEFSTLEDMLGAWFFVGFGFFISILCGISLYVNRKAYIHVDEDKISAFCHFGLALECNLSEVSNVSFGGTGLNLQLKNGKKYNLMNLENAYQIGKFIQKKISIKPAISLNKDQLISAITLLKKKRKLEGISSIICFLLLFPGILLIAALTGWKDLQEFAVNDWIVFSVMVGIGSIVTVVFCILLRKYLLDTDEVDKMQKALYQVILQTVSVLPGNAIKLFFDDEIYPSIRLTIYGYPNSDDVYFTVEQVNQNYELECIHTSRVYANINELLPEIEGMTERVLP